MNQNELTIEKVKKDYQYMESLFGKTSSYHNVIEFLNFGVSCDIFIKALGLEISQNQIDQLNNFQKNYLKYIPKIDQFIFDSLKSYERKKADIVKFSNLAFHVLEVPLDDSKFDFVLICGKNVRLYWLLKVDISLRVEFKDGKILSIERKKDITNENA